MSHIHFDEGDPNPYGWIPVLVIHEGATDPQVMRDTIIERYKDDQIRWRREPEAHDQQLFETNETRFWCAARLSVMKHKPIPPAGAPVDQRTYNEACQKIQELIAANKALEKERDDIAQLCDPAGIVNENTLLKDQAAALAKRNAELVADYADIQGRHIEMHKKHDELTDKLAELVAINEALEHRLGDPE